jgi:hypothetical protein
MNINQEIEKYVIHLKFKEHNGSGVVLKPFEGSDYCYIFTAKHTFEFEDKYGIKTFISPLDNLADFKITTYPFKQFKINSIVKIAELNTTDLLILCIQNHNYSFWNDIKPMNVFSVDLDKNKNYIVAGFPAINSHNKIEFYNSNFVKRNSDYTIEVYSKKPLATAETTEIDTNSGISGGGLFVMGNNNQLYLAGIEIEYEPIQKLKCINLVEIIDIINQKLPNKIKIGGYPILDEYNLFDIKFDLSTITKELENDYIREVKDKSIEFVRDKDNDINKKLNKEYQDLVKKMSDIANSYLYRGALFNGTYNQLATNNFKRAIRLNSELEVYLKEAKYIRNRANYKGIEEKEKRENQLNIYMLEDKIENEKDKETLKGLYLNLLFFLQRDEALYQKDITKYMKKLIDLYIETADFQEAERILGNYNSNKFLDRGYIKQKLFEIYLYPKYLDTTKLSKKEYGEKLIDLLEMFEFASKEYSQILQKLKGLNIFDDYIFDLKEKLVKSERKFDIYEKNIQTLSYTVKDMKMDAKKNNKTNKILHFTIYFILGILALTDDALIQGLNTLFEWFKAVELWNK